MNGGTNTNMTSRYASRFLKHGSRIVYLYKAGWPPSAVLGLCTGTAQRQARQLEKYFKAVVRSCMDVLVQNAASFQNALNQQLNTVTLHDVLVSFVPIFYLARNNLPNFFCFFSQVAQL